ncbi:MAG: phosphatase PAP2 family protein [Isosphaeraceae bacterium]
MERWLSRAIEWVGGHGGVVLAGLLIPVTGVLAFILLADKVMEGRTQRMDEKIVRALRRPDNPALPLGPAWIPEVARDITALGSVTLIVLNTGAVAGYLVLGRKYAATLFLLGAIGSGFALSAFLKSLFQRPRPALVPHLMQASYSSFPSGHSMMSAVVYLTLGALLARLVAGERQKFYALTVAVALTGLVGVSRVYMGVHYPTDVLAGWCAGLVWASLCWLAGRRLQRQGAIEREG